MNIALRRFLHNHNSIVTEGSPKSGLCLTLIKWLQWSSIVHSAIYSTMHSTPLNSFGHCISTTPMTNIWPDRYSNPVPLSFVPQPDWMFHRVIVVHSQQTRDMAPMLFWCSADVEDGVPTSKQHWINISCLLGIDYIIEQRIHFDMKLKRGSHRAGDYLATLANAKFMKFS